VANQKVNATIANLQEDFFITSATFSTTSGTKSYALPSDFRFIRRLEHYSTSDPNDIVKVDEMPFPRTEGQHEWPWASNGKPTNYVIRGSQLDIYPIPDDAYPMRLYYDARQSDLNQDSDSPTSPIEFHDMIALWAAILGLVKNAEPSTELQMLYKVRENDLVETFVHRNSGEDDRVEGFLEGW
jgi:hypothetical protein